jgi:hypothetical protein
MSFLVSYQAPTGWLVQQTTLLIAGNALLGCCMAALTFEFSRPQQQEQLVFMSTARHSPRKLLGLPKQQAQMD